MHVRDMQDRQEHERRASQQHAMQQQQREHELQQAVVQLRRQYEGSVSGGESNISLLKVQQDHTIAGYKTQMHELLQRLAQQQALIGQERQDS
jgi:hypothetical protein